MNVKILITSVLGMLAISLAANSEDKWSFYEERYHDCLEAMNYHMGDEKRYAQMLGVVDAGESSCAIGAMFANEEDLLRFRNTRKENGLSPDSVIYNNKEIEIEVSFGEMFPH